MAQDVPWPANYCRLPSGFYQNNRSRRIFLQEVFQKKGIGAVKDLKMAFRFSRDRLDEQDLNHLVEAYDDSTSYRNRTGNFLYYSEEAWRREFNEEINQIVTSHHDFVDSDYENKEAPGYRRRRSRPKRRVYPDLLEFMRMANSEEKVKRMAEKIGKTLPFVYVDMRWLMLFHPAQLNSLPESVFLDLFEYCVLFNKRTGRRLFPGMEAALICNRWKDRHSKEMLAYAPGVAKELQGPTSTTSPLKEKYFYPGLGCSVWEDLLFSNRVNDFLSGLDQSILEEMRVKCQFTKLSLPELGAHTLLELYRNISHLPPRGSFATEPDWSQEINCYVNRKTLLTATNCLAPFVLPTLSMRYSKDNGINFVKYLAWTNFQVLIAIRHDLRQQDDVLIHLDVNMLQSSYFKCSAQLRELSTIDDIVQSEEWKASFEKEMQVYKAYVVEVRWITMEEVRKNVCTVAGVQLEIGKQEFLSYLAYNHTACLVRMRFLLAQATTPLIDHSERELWEAFYQCKITEPEITAMFDLDHAKQLQGWTNEFSREIASYNSSNTPSACLEDTYRKILLHTGVTPFLGVLNKCHVYPMTVLAHEVYQEKLEKLGPATVWNIFKEVIQKDFKLADYGNKALKDQWVLEANGYRRMGAAEYLHQFKVLPDIFKLRPEMEPYPVPPRDGEESVSHYIKRNGVAAFLRLLNFDQLRTLRLITHGHEYQNRLDDLDEEMMIATWEEATISGPVGPANIEPDIWNYKYSLEIKEYYYSGVYAPKNAWILDDQIMTLIRPSAYCESDLRAVMRRPFVKMSRISIWQEHKDLFPDIIKTLEEIPEDWYNQCKQWMTEKKPYCNKPLRHAVREGRYSMNQKDLRMTLWHNHLNLFPEHIQALNEMPIAWWKQCETWIKDTRPAEYLYFEDEGVPRDMPMSAEVLHNLNGKTVWVSRWPAINPEYLTLMLIYSPLSIEDICLKFLGLHFKFPIFINSPTVINEIENMSCKRLAVIYKLLMGNPDCTTHSQAVHERSATKTAKRRHVGKRSTCSWCYHRSSHFSNICVIKYTKQMRLEEAELNQTCLVCGLWNRTDCPVRNEHPKGQRGIFSEAELFCRRCAQAGLPSRHTNNMCLKESRFVNEYGTVLRQVRTVAKATMGLSEEVMVEIYRKVIQFFKENTKAPNAYRYEGEDWKPDHFDVEDLVNDHRFKLGQKRLIKPLRSNHSPPRDKILRAPLPIVRYHR